ncbi:MAG: hypothetical protein GYB16_07390 [Gammaproteobacteria bacterium]|nr:hypothetical protein [Gammaproteobacteria bacterium]
MTDFEELSVSVNPLRLEAEHSKYWQAATQTLNGALALIQQAVEFYLKGRIVKVSPFLLITGNPQAWPKRCAKENLSFSDFRSIDAQDLIKVHNTVCSDRLTEQTEIWFSELRKARNKVMHSVGESSYISPIEAIEFILYAHYEFSQEKDWLEARRRFIWKSPVFRTDIIKEDEDTEPELQESLLVDFAFITNVLKPAQLKNYFGIIRGRNRTFCPSCVTLVAKRDFWDTSFLEFYGKTYQQIESSSLYKCCLCNYTGKIVDQKCSEWGCDGAMIDSGRGICLTCYFENGAEHKG